jgi:hypothetical protein
MTMPDGSDRPEITVKALVDHWRSQGRKLTEAGVPLERVVVSLREACLQAENEWFQGLIDEAKERLAAIGPPATVHREEAAPADVSLTAEANHLVMPDAARVATEEKTET